MYTPIYAVQLNPSAQSNSVEAERAFPAAYPAAFLVISLHLYFLMSYNKSIKIQVKVRKLYTCE